MAAIKINFDTDHNPIVPMFILGDRMGNRLGVITNISNINVSDKMNDCPEISFTVYKYNNGEQCLLWDKIQNLMTTYCPEWKTWFEVGIDVSDESDILKNVILTRITEAELSQLYLYNFESNTDDDIDLREIGKTTILYNKDDKTCSLLDRMIKDKAPHYSIAHVDESIAKEQREFSFDKTTIRDAFNEISEELNCLFVYGTSDDEGNLVRTISVYDLENYCIDCGYRGEFSDKCPKCGNTNIRPGYGKNTNIFVSSDGLGNSVKLEVEKDSIKNCFRLEAGDEIITDAVKLCNPNNSLYIWNFSDYMKSLMPDILKNKLDEYNNTYNEYNNTKEFLLDENLVTSYNTIIDKYNGMLDYKEGEEEYEKLKKDKIEQSIIGFPNLIDDYYNVIDMAVYLESELMPNVKIDGTTAQEQLNILLDNMEKGVSAEKLSSVSKTTAKSAILSIAKVIVDGRYQVEIEDEYTYDKTTYIWTGKFIVTNISDEEETVTSDNVNIKFNENYESFIKDKINNMLNEDEYNTSITWLFDPEKCSIETFTSELHKYGLNSLRNFEVSCYACIELMIQQEINKSKDLDVYNKLYKVYEDRGELIKAEIISREEELDTVLSIQSNIEDVLDAVYKALDLTIYMGDLYPVLCSYIREDEYSNSNYISDGLSNAEIIEKAKEFLVKAEKELYKASHLQHKISADIKNLLTIKEFEPLVEQFECGNWICVRVDEEIFKLRLLEYEINYDDHLLNVVFSDVSKIFDGVTDLRSIIEQASSMAGSFNAIVSQMEKTTDKAKYIDGWVSEGINITNVSLKSDAYNQAISWDKKGLLCRESDVFSETGYRPEQLKIINNGLYLTEDNWKTTKTGIGMFSFYNPLSKTTETKYGIVADAVVSNLVLSEEVGIYNEANNIILNKDGFTITNGSATVVINPNDESVFTVRNNKENVISMTKEGNLIIVGQIKAVEGSEINGDKITGLSNVAFSGKYSDLSDQPDLSGYITSADMSVYISKDGVVGNTPSEGSTGFKVSNKGLLEASNAIIYGSLYSSNGKIGGWSLNNNCLYNGTSNMTSTNVGTYIGTDGIRQYKDEETYVDIKDGMIKAVGGEIIGSSIIGGNISIGDNFNVDTYGNVIGSSFIISVDGRYVPSQYMKLGCNGLLLHTDYTDSNSGITYDNGNIYLSASYANTAIYLTDVAINTENPLDEYNNWKVKLDSSGTISALYSINTMTVSANNIILFTDVNGNDYGIKTIAGDNTGIGMQIGTGGLIVLGSGESTQTLLDNSNKYSNGSTEQTFITSDNCIYLYAGMGTWSNTKKLVLDGNANLFPEVTKEWSIGTSAHRFADGYFTTIYNSSGAVTSSDARIKRDFTKIPNPEEFIMSLKPTQYKYIDGDSNRNHWGFIAQEVKESLDNICKTDCGLYIEDVKTNDSDTSKPLSECTYEEKELGLRYEELIAPHIALTQKHNQEITQLKAEIAQLKQLLNITI